MRNVRCPVDRCRYSSKTFVCNHSKWHCILQGTEVDVVQCYVLEIVLWLKKVMENCMFSCLYCMEQRICGIWRWHCSDHEVCCLLGHVVPSVDQTTSLIWLVWYRMSLLSFPCTWNIDTVSQRLPGHPMCWHAHRHPQLNCWY